MSNHRVPDVTMCTLCYCGNKRPLHEYIDDLYKRIAELEADLKFAPPHAGEYFLEAKADWDGQEWSQPPS